MRFLATLVCVALVAGCVDAVDEPTDVAPAPPPAEGGATALAAPVWAVGDFWRYESDPETEWAWTSVVTSDRGSSYTLDVDSPFVAFNHAQQAITFVGPQRKGDLAASQESGWVEWLSWPLTHGKTWTMNLDGTRLDVEATAREDGTFYMAATRSSELVYDFVYDPAVKWFTERTSYANGSVEWRNILQEHGSAWQGDVVRYTLNPLAAVVVNGPGGDVKTVTIPAGWTDLWLDVTISCAESGHIIFATGPVENVPTVATGEDGDGFTDEGACPRTTTDAGVIGAAPFEGTWGYLYEVSAADGVIDAVLTLRALELIAVG